MTDSQWRTLRITLRCIFGMLVCIFTMLVIIYLRGLTVHV